MRLKKIVPFILLLSFFAGAQTEVQRFEKPGEDELKMSCYEKDSTAGAVFLYEKGENYINVIDDKIRLVKKYYAKIKIFKRSEFKQATIKIPLYRGVNTREEIINIKAVTNNGSEQTFLNEKNIYTEHVNQRLTEISFTFPNIREGSILEYEYTLLSPFFFNFKGWKFQTDIPKVYSEFSAQIPGNYVYNRNLRGPYKLSKNEASLKKRCFHPLGVPSAADCEVLTYAMKDIPAFVEEKYLTSKENYISKIEFELSEYIRFDGIRKKYTKTWKDVDKEFRSDKEIGGQMRKTSYFTQILDDSISPLPVDELERAKKVYTFIKEHYTWNEDYNIFGDTNVKRAFQERTGSVGDINLSLINALKAAKIKTDLVLLSTRNNGLPTKLHPVITDFNYILAKSSIHGKEYLLDATEKLLPFGMIPYRCLNGYGRVMDFKNDSYWMDIEPRKKNINMISVQMEMDEEGHFNGSFRETNRGYFGYSKRIKIKEKDKEDYLDKKEEELYDWEISDYKIKNLNALDKPVIEEFRIDFSDTSNNSEIFINPFIVQLFSENPFSLEKRNYPVEFGYPFSHIYRLAVQLPKNYTIKEIPKQRAFTLNDNDATISFQINRQSDRELTLQFKIIVNNYFYNPEKYTSLKDFFSKIVDIEKNSFVIIQKSD